MSVAAHHSFRQAKANGTRRSREDELSRLLRDVRERLVANRHLPIRFERELVLQHASVLLTAATVLPLPILLAGFWLSVFVGQSEAVLWSLLALVGPLVLLAMASRLKIIESRSSASFDPRRWTRLFLFGHLVAGLAWAYIAWMDCRQCGASGFEIFQFSVLVVAVALTAMVSATLRGAALVAFFPLAGVLVLRALMEPQPTAALMLLVPLGAVFLFALVAARLRATAIERLRHQAEKDELIAELEQARIASDEARKRAEEANLAKSRFLATMSHELRTPLNAILGFSEVITNEILGPLGNPTYREYITDIHASGRHLLDLINEILDLSRVEAGRYALNEEAIDLVQVAKSCVGYIQLKADMKQVAIVTRFERRLPQIWADPRALRQVVLNLLSNAVKFAPLEGEIVVCVGWTAGGGQYVSVSDNGPGIPEDEIPLVLSSFGQGSTAIKSAEQGTGLGLPIVQALVHLHDGEFQLNSKLREGTEAIAILPHARVLEVMPAMSELM